MRHTPESRSHFLGRRLRHHREAAGLSVEHLAARAGLTPDRLRGIEAGQPSHRPDLHCGWGEQSAAVLDRLCRTAERIEVFAPFGSPRLDGVGHGRRTTYVLENAPITPMDGATRIVPPSMFLGAERPMVLFELADGSSIVFFPYLHEAFFTEAPDEVEAARSIFSRLHNRSSAA